MGRSACLRGPAPRVDSRRHGDPSILGLFDEEVAPDVLPLLRGSSMGWGGSHSLLKPRECQRCFVTITTTVTVIIINPDASRPYSASKRNRGFRPSATTLSIPLAARLPRMSSSHVLPGNTPKPRTLSELALLLGWTESIGPGPCCGRES